LSLITKTTHGAHALSGLIYFQLARGEGLSPHLQEVKLGEDNLLVGAARGARSRASSCGAPRPMNWGGWGRRAGRDIGPWMGSGPWLGMLGRLRCREMHVVDQRWRQEIGEKESCGNVRLEKETKTNRDFFEPMQNNQVRKRTYSLEETKHVRDICKKKRPSRSDQNARTW
jgi:hypothetical protein